MNRELAEFVSHAATTTRHIVRCPDGEYRIWRSRSGAEVWLHYPMPSGQQAGAALTAPHFDPIDQLMGLSIAHAGRSAVTLRIGRSLRIAPNNRLDGVSIATLASSRSGERRVPFTFELIGFAAEPQKQAFVADVHVVGLAQRIWAYATETDYLRATPAHLLIGKGSMLEVEPSDVPEVPMIYRPKPGTLWLITGEVVRSVRLVNEITGEPYMQIELATDRGTFDLLSSPEMIEGDVSHGHTVAALAALSGRIVRGRQ